MLKITSMRAHNEKKSLHALDAVLFTKEKTTYSWIIILKASVFMLRNMKY